VLQSFEVLDDGNPVLLDPVYATGKVLSHDADVFIHQVPQNCSTRVVPTGIGHQSKVRAKNWCKEDLIIVFQVKQAWSERQEHLMPSQYSGLLEVSHVCLALLFHH